MIGLIGDREGFTQTGGIQTLVQLLCGRLQREGFTYRILTQTQHGTDDYSSLVVVGCSSPWAYGVVLKALLTKPGMAIHWIPCYHPPRFVTHRRRAQLAGWALRRLQRFGVWVHAMSQSEQAYLNRGRCSLSSLPFDCEGSVQKRSGGAVATQIPRRYALVFLGRPVAQKGWLPFLQIVEQLDWPCLGIIPYQPKDRIPANLTVLVGAQDDAVAAGLRESKILILPSDYESFGFAQAEALLSGCCVPILGEWPLWLNVPELDWRGLSPPQTAQRVREILADPERLSQLRSRQMQSWNLRAERQAPALPPLHG